MPNIQVRNRVFLNEDKTKAVPEGHPEARSLLIGANGSVSEETAKRYSLSELGAPGQSEGAKGAGVVMPHGVNENSPDGVNTAPGSPAATGVAALAAATAAADSATTAANTAAAADTGTKTADPAGAAKGKPGRPSK